MLGSERAVAPSPELEGRLEDRLELGREDRLAAGGRAGHRAQGTLDLDPEHLRPRPDPFQHLEVEACALAQDPQQEVLGADGFMATAPRLVRREDHGAARPLRELLDHPGPPQGRRGPSSWSSIGQAENPRPRRPIRDATIAWCGAPSRTGRAAVSSGSPPWGGISTGRRELKEELSCQCTSTTATSAGVKSKS